MGLINGCFGVPELTAGMPRVVWVVLSRIDNHMQCIYHQ